MNAPVRQRLAARVVMAMPIGPPYGGMTSNTAILRRSAIFDGDRAALLDTSPPSSDYSVASRAIHSAKLFRRLVETVRTHRAEVVFFSSSSFAGFYEKATMALLCQRLGAKSVVHLVGSFMEFREAARPLARLVIDRLLGRFDCVLVVSDNVRAYFAKHIPGANVGIVPNPVACEEFPIRTRERRDDGKLQILFAGAIVKGKGVLDLLAAVQTAKDRLAGVKVIWIGDGPLLEPCRRAVQETGLGHIIEILGFVDDATKKRLFRTSDLFVLPSHFEAMPVAALEASSTGIPVVVTDVGGVRSAVSDGVTGLVVPPRDPQRLADALVRLVENAELRRMMGEQGARWVRSRFDAPIVASLLIERFNALVGERDR